MYLQVFHCEKILQQENMAPAPNNHYNLSLYTIAITLKVLQLLYTSHMYQSFQFLIFIKKLTTPVE